MKKRYSNGGYITIYPEMLKEDYDALLSELEKDEDIKTKQDVIEYIQDMVMERDKEAYIPVSYIESYKYHTNTEEERALAEAVKVILKDWSKTCWFERYGEEE